jgi:pilus assembly protein CpaC
VVTPHLVKPMARNTVLKELPGEIYQDYTPSFTTMLFGDPQKGSKTSKSQSSPETGVGFSN